MPTALTGRTSKKKNAQTSSETPRDRKGAGETALIGVTAEQWSQEGAMLLGLETYVCKALTLPMFLSSPV